MHDVSYLLVLLIGLLLAVAAVAGLARRFAVSYPIALVIFGLLCSLIPRVPRIPLPPSIVFFVILPPLLYIAAWQTSWREFKYNLVSISSLAVLLVFFTAFGVAFAAQVVAAWIRLAAGVPAGSGGFADRRGRGNLDRPQSGHAAAHRGSAGGREPAKRRDRTAGAAVRRPDGRAGNDAIAWRAACSNSRG